MKRNSLSFGLKLLAISTILLSLLAACGDNNAGGGAPVGGTHGGETQTEAQAGTADAEESGREFFEFTMFMNYEWYDTSPVFGQDETSRYLLERFNTSLTLAKPDTDPDTMMNLMIAAGDLPDAIMLDRGAHYFTMAQNGMLFPLDDLINAGSNYARLLSAEVRESAKIDGVTYGILNWPTDETSPTGNNGVVLNTRIHDMLGNPPITTTEELYEYLLMVQQQVPELDGNPIIPMSAHGNFGDFHSFFGGLRGLSGQGVFLDNNEFRLIYHDPAFVDAIHFMNRLFNQDLINRDILIETNDQFLERLAIGRVAVFVGNMAEHIRPSRMRLREIDPLADYTVIRPPAAPGLSQDEIWLDFFHTIGWNVLVINNQTERPDRIFELFDFLFSEEGTVVMYYGPRGFIWEETDADGFPYLTTDVDALSEQERNELGLFIWSFPGNSVFANNMGNAITARLPVEDWQWGELYHREFIWNHSRPMTEFAMLFNDLTLNDPNSEVAIIRERYWNYNEELLPRLITANSPSEIDTLIQQAIDEVMAMNFQTYLDHINQLWINR